MKLTVYNGSSKVKDITVSEIWDEPSEKVLHQVVVARLANQRRGTASAKTRAEVNGGGRKPWKQKGLGRARAGTATSPIWRGGGVTFGPKPRDFSKKINKKQKTIAYLYVFNKMNELGKLKVVSEFKVDEIKTKSLIKKLSDLTENVNSRICLIVDEADTNMLMSSRNLKNVTVKSVETLDILPLVYADTIIATESAILKIDEKFQKIMKG